LAVAAGIASALPRHVLSLNLLPEAQRQAGSPLVWVPSAALGAAALVLGGALWALPAFEEKRYAKTLNQEIAQVQPAVNRAGALDSQIVAAKRRMELLDELRRRPKADMDALLEMTRIIPPPTWLNLFELNGKQIVVGGETDQAAPLLKVIDSSPYFESSEFTASPVRIQAVEMFRVRTNREVRPVTPDAPKVPAGGKQ
jgi:Tfp pilus assembly protein PilN